MILVWDEFYWSGHVADLGSLGREMEVHVKAKDEERVPPHYFQVDLWKRIVGENTNYAELVCTG